MKLNLKTFSAFILILLFFLNSCEALKPKKTKAGEVPVNWKDRVEKNMKEGKGFRLMDMKKKGGGTFDFASSNELWRATLDTISFMPLLSANYSGGIIITDWYSEDINKNESIKLSIRFLSNKVETTSLNVKVFTKICKPNSTNCEITENKGSLSLELKKSILKKAAIYERKRKEDPNYVLSTPDN